MNQYLICFTAIALKFWSLNYSKFENLGKNKF